LSSTQEKFSTEDFNIFRGTEVKYGGAKRYKKTCDNQIANFSLRLDQSKLLLTSLPQLLPPQYYEKIQIPLTMASHHHS